MLAAGSRLGAYEVLSVLGEGGMGEVYQAHDTNLGRDVALKVIRPLLRDDAEHIVRFRREAHVLASLNHPHIATIHELNEVEGVAFLVMELVRGETLRDRLASGPLRIADALRLGTQIAAALETAHDQGIIHRDLKPANVKITPDGTVKVLDFGLAKAVIADSPAMLSQSPTAFVSQNVILGTVPYMSPEQARGKAVDRRSDIWSFGCVLFEMLTGRRPFDGETTSDIIAAILEREPDWRLLPVETPPAASRTLRRCLQKDLGHRLRDIGDARLELDDALLAPSRPSRNHGAPAPPWSRLPGSARLVAALAVGLVGGAVLGTMIARQPRATVPVAPAHFLMSLPSGAQLAGLDFPAVALSPDGSLLAYVGVRGGRAQLFLRALNSLESTPVPGTADALAPFFSPDSRWLAFFAGGQLMKVPVTGGAPIAISDARIGFGGSWGSDDTIVFAPSTGAGLSRVAAAGGSPVRVTTVDAQSGEFSHRWPELLPDGKSVLFTVGTVGSWDDAQIVAQSLSSSGRVVLVRGGTNPHYLPSGHLMYARGGALMVVPFDAGRLQVRGTPVRVLDSVMESADGAAQIAVSRSGSVAYIAGSLESNQRRLVAVDRSGGAAPLAAPPLAYVTPRVSADGRRLVVTVAGATEDLWLYDMAAASLTQLTFDANASAPILTPDGERVTYASTKAGAPNLFSSRLAAGGDERLTSSESLQAPGSWSPDGRTLVFVERNATTGRDIWMLPYGGDRVARPFLASPSDESAPRFSPDGRWIAYVSNASGRNEVYVCASDAPSRKTQVSRNGGAEPVWARGGQELFYRAEDRMVAVSAVAGAEPRFAEPRVLFEGRFEKGTIDAANYDVTPDPLRFVMVRAVEAEATQGQLHVVLNWLAPAVSTAFGSR